MTHSLPATGLWDTTHRVESINVKPSAPEIGNIIWLKLAIMVMWEKKKIQDTEMSVSTKKGEEGKRKEASGSFVP